MVSKDIRGEDYKEIDLKAGVYVTPSADEKMIRIKIY